jgi:hypothetical protein
MTSKIDTRLIISRTLEEAEEVDTETTTKEAITTEVVPPPIGVEVEIIRARGVAINQTAEATTTTISINQESNMESWSRTPMSS